MSERPYKVKDLQDYTGILTQHVDRSNFKMELKVEDNPVLEKSVEEIDPSIELNFHYNLGTSTKFFHDIHRCPCNRQSERCNECKKVIETYDIFEANLDKLQVGDTFKIKAALINNEQSELPVSIQSFRNYERIEVACVHNWLRLPDSPEGINKKYELKEQRLQREREAEEKRKEDEEQAQKDARRRKRKETFQQFFGDSPMTTTIFATAIGSVIAGIILATIFNPIPLLFKYLYYLISQIRNRIVFLL